MKADNFQLTDISIEVFKRDGQVKKMNYSDISSIIIHEDTKYSANRFALIYWTTWIFFVFGLLSLIAGAEYFFSAFKEIGLWGLTFTLGLMAYRPIYSMLPKGTFMDIKSMSDLERVAISDLVEDERIHGLIGHLKQKMDLSKIRIKN